MATVAFHIRSTYDPEGDRDRLEAETGQYDDEAHDQADPWLTEKPFGSSKRIANPPMFVAATIDYKEWGSSSSLDQKTRHAGGLGEEEGIESIGGWYKSLARKSPTGTPRSVTPTTRSPAPPLPRDAREKKRKPVKRDRNNWFISRALEASSSSSNADDSSSQTPAGSGTTSPRAPTPTLADILARDPPPLPTEQKYTPPVWIAIGPSNRGFAMLQKSGWEEGEALGRASRNRVGLGYSVKGKERKREVGDNGGADYDGEVEEVRTVKREVVDATSTVDGNEVIDLTGLDEESPDLDDTFTKRSVQSTRTTSFSTSNTDIDHSPHALLTPLPTILKSDKLGIGLKAKTIGTGIHREPVKRVTHSQAALAVHIRTSEEQRRVKKLMGRGKRGFERVRKREEEGRKRLLAYLNT